MYAFIVKVKVNNEIAIVFIIRIVLKLSYIYKFQSKYKTHINSAIIKIIVELNNIQLLHYKWPDILDLSCLSQIGQVTFSIYVDDTKINA